MNRGLILFSLFVILFGDIYVDNKNIFSNEINQTQIVSKEISSFTPVDIDIFLLEDKLHLNKDSVYNQALTCFSKPFGDKHGRSTNVHETVHGINNALSNSRKNYRGFYAGFSRGLWLKEPNITMVDIIPYIPDILKEYRYDLYFVSQLRYWKDVGLYPIDEWSAYISGAECAVDDHLCGIISKDKADSVSGALEFSIYCTALAKAVKSRDAEYWNTYPQFKNTIKFLLVRSEKVFMEGRYFFPSQRQESLLSNLRSNESAKPIRDFLVEEFQGVFIDHE